MQKVYRITMGRAACSVDLGDGSERGEYVNQDYILSRLGRPHRSISLMYCYYPLDKEWPARISEYYKDKKIAFQWDYPYDDYFPYHGGLNGSRDGEPFVSMRDIRRHGQDVTLTLTIDPFVSDEHLAAIGEDLKMFGRLFLRINHEATGNWFQFNRRADYKQVADFYCRAVKIIKKHAPNVRTILCIGGIEDINAEKMVKEDEFAQAVRDTDIWSVDKYMALHWGWPVDVAENGGTTHNRNSVREVFELTRRSYERFQYINGGVSKPMIMSELNADGNVTGPYEQADMIRLFCNIIEEKKADWLSGFCFYQFRDRGRLGLEREDPNNVYVGIEQPVMHAYRELINREIFLPSMTLGEEIELPVKLIWRNSEDAEGIAVPIYFEAPPVFCELYFEDDSNLMLELNGRWFYKSPTTKYVDLMPAFYENNIKGECELTIKIFSPPAIGENDLTTEEGMFSYSFIIEKLPEIRIRTAPIEPDKDNKKGNI